MKPKKPSFIFFIAIAAMLLHLTRPATEAMPASSSSSSSSCNGTIAECETATAELGLSPAAHRWLQQRQGRNHISYDVLRYGNAEACNPGGGNALVNCVPRRNGNQRTRDCLPFQHCRL